MSVKLAPHYRHFSNSMKVLTSFAIFLEFLTVFRNSSGKLRKIWLLEISTIFFKISFLRVPRVLFRVLDSFQIVLQISPNIFYSKTKIRKTIALQRFQIIFENYKEIEIFLWKKRKFSKISFIKSSTSSVQNSGLNSNSSRNKFWYYFLKKIQIQNTKWVESRTLKRTLRILKNEIFKNYSKTLKYHSFLNFDFRTKCIWTYL